MSNDMKYKLSRSGFKYATKELGYDKHILADQSVLEWFAKNDKNLESVRVNNHYSLRKKVNGEVSIGFESKIKQFIADSKKKLDVLKKKEKETKVNDYLLDLNNLHESIGTVATEYAN